MRITDSPPLMESNCTHPTVVYPPEMKQIKKLEQKKISDYSFLQIHHVRARTYYSLYLFSRSVVIILLFGLSSCGREHPANKRTVIPYPQTKADFQSADISPTLIYIIT